MSATHIHSGKLIFHAIMKNNVLGDIVKDLDLSNMMEPEQNLDVTPVYGSLEDSLGWSEGGLTVTANGGGMLADTSSMTFSQEVVCVTSVNSDVGAVISEKTSEGEFGNGGREEKWRETSWEGERPHTPTLVQEMQEEESMERESKDREEILKETQAIDTQKGEDIEVEDEPEQNLDATAV